MSGSGDDMNGSCVDLYNEGYIRALIGVRSILSLISSAWIVCMIAIMVLFQKYRVYIQRLILYLAISTLSYQVVASLDVASLYAYSNQHALNYCIMIGFLTQVTEWWPILSTCVIVLDIFVKIVFLKKMDKLEKLFIFVIFASPLFFSWLPFINDSYGPSNYLCWIRDRNYDDCSHFKFGFILRFVLFYAPIYTLTGLMFVLLGTSILAIRKRKGRIIGDANKCKNEENHRKMIEKEIKPLMSYPLIFLITNIVSLVLTVYLLAVRDVGGVALLVLGLLLSMAYSIEGIFITIVFILDRETRMKLTMKGIKDAWRQLFQKEQTVNYPLDYGQTDSVR